MPTKASTIVVIERLKGYGIHLDLSEPAEIKMEHVALEDDAFARKVVKKGLLYFRSVVHAADSTGDPMDYVISIDKSKTLHLEFEGTEAQHLAEEYEAFIDDVVSKKIDRKTLRELPQKFENVQTHVVSRFDQIEKTLTSSVEGIQKTQTLLHENQLQFSQNLLSHIEMVRKMSEAAESLRVAADTIKELLSLSMARSSTIPSQHS